LRRDELFESILAGGYPPVVARNTSARRKTWFPMNDESPRSTKATLTQGMQKVE
jgi:hypothetical protein